MVKLGLLNAISTTVLRPMRDAYISRPSMELVRFFNVGVDIAEPLVVSGEDEGWSRGEGGGDSGPQDTELDFGGEVAAPSVACVLLNWC